jgi:RNA-directed DNA polymerase
MFGFIRRLLGKAPASAVEPPRPGPLGVDELVRRLGVGERELRDLPVSYRSLTLPKRTGGVRSLAVPSSALKAMQRRILRGLLRNLLAHPCATGFERGHSIVTNARPHVGQELVIKLDLKDFFGSTSAGRVEHYFHRIGWNAEAAALLVRLCTHAGGLPTGAPTSPRLSNLVNYRLDARLDALARCYGMSYSRYADDLTFSGPAIRHYPHHNPKTLAPLPPESPARVNDIINRVKRILARDGYTLHTDKKLRIARRHDRQIVTGLVVNEKVQLPRATRRWLRAVEHRLATSSEATLTPAQLAGWRALGEMVEKQA